MKVIIAWSLRLFWGNLQGQNYSGMIQKCYLLFFFFQCFITYTDCAQVVVSKNSWSPCQIKTTTECARSSVIVTAIAFTEDKALCKNFLVEDVCLLACVKLWITCQHHVLEKAINLPILLNLSSWVHDF
jgi:hypothetical protein